MVDTGSRSDTRPGSRPDILRDAAGVDEAHTLLVWGDEGKVRHIAIEEGDTLPNHHRGVTWCNMFFDRSKARAAVRERDLRLPICGGCLRHYRFVATWDQGDGHDGRDEGGDGEGRGE